MGAINYGTSDYITMGMQPLQVQELENNFDFADSYMEDIYGAAENELDKYDFYYYRYIYIFFNRNKHHFVFNANTFYGYSFIYIFMSFIKYHES